MRLGGTSRHQVAVALAVLTACLEAALGDEVLLAAALEHAPAGEPIDQLGGPAGVLGRDARGAECVEGVAHVAVGKSGGAEASTVLDGGEAGVEIGVQVGHFGPS